VGQLDNPASIQRGVDSPQPAEAPSWEPVGLTERVAALDVLRGLALLGVLLVNLLTAFRVSLFEHILTFHTHPGWLDRSVDVLVAGLLEFKAFGLFSLTFGIGVCIQAERALARGVRGALFLLRRFLILLGFGLIHLFIIWNGDILALYAVCGLLLLPLLRLRPALLLVLAAGSFALTYILPFDALWPSEAVLRGHAARATLIYTEGTLGEILAFRRLEAWQFIVPLLVSVLPRTFALMLLGIAAWRSGVLREPGQHRAVLWIVLLGAGGVGAMATVVQVMATSSGRPVSTVVEACSSVPLALGYAAALFLWMGPGRPAPLLAPVAAVGQMALTNYLVQSLVLGFVFYSYGLGLFGKLGPAAAAAIGLVLYAGQLAFSWVWLRRYRFGPFEWLWRSLTYGRAQPMRRGA
jgi:uncharacterized protein